MGEARRALSSIATGFGAASLACGLGVALLSGIAAAVMSLCIECTERDYGFAAAVALAGSGAFSFLVGLVAAIAGSSRETGVRWFAVLVAVVGALFSVFGGAYLAMRFA